MEIGVIFLGPTDIKSAITSFRITFLSAGSVEFWLTKGVGGIDYKTLHLEAGSSKEAL